MSRLKSKTILVADDDADILNAARVALESLEARVELFDAPHKLRAAIETMSVDAVLLDMNFTAGATHGEEGLNLLDACVRRAPDVSIVLMTAFGQVSLAVEALKRGAADFVLKPWQNEKLVATMGAAMALTQAKREAARGMIRSDTLALESEAQNGALQLTSDRFRDVSSRARKAAPTDASILILGESGTGKEVTARDIHRFSQRASGPFVAVDLGSIPESLFESELFGYRRGAFTGAMTDRVGLIEAANKGTLFLDEIGNLPVHLQAKLLTVLERREVVPLGSARPVEVDLRLISATNLTPEELTRPARFRQDLLFRIKTIQLTLPPLRERRADVAPLLDYFLAYFARKYRVRQRRISAAAMAVLETYPWPGNIRELRQAAESATILASGDEFVPEDFAFLQTTQMVSSPEATLALDQLERQAIQRALQKFDGNISKAAIALGLTRPALYRRITRHGL